MDLSQMAQSQHLAELGVAINDQLTHLGAGGRTTWIERDDKRVAVLVATDLGLYVSLWQHPGGNDVYADWVLMSDLYPWKEVTMTVNSSLPSMLPGTWTSWSIGLSLREQVLLQAKVKTTGSDERAQLLEFAGECFRYAASLS